MSFLSNLFQKRDTLVRQIVLLNERIGELRGEVAKLSREASAAGEAIKLQERVTALRKQLTELEIEKSQRQEEFDRREREITHKVGLEKTRQEQELALARREAKVEAGEANLQAERKEFGDRMTFREKQFDEQTVRLDDLLKQILQRLPTVTVDRTETVSRRR